MSFKGIYGQDKAISFLTGSIENGRVAHAYIFTGPPGVGKRSAALVFAKALNCGRTPGEGPSGPECESCAKIGAGKHPDIFLVKPEAKEGKGSPSIGIDAVREVIKNVALKPFEARKKVYIIDEAEAMTQEASSALLKTLEEPSSESVLILICRNLRALPSTIISRAQTVRFFPLGFEDLRAILIKEYKADGVRAHILAHLSSGSLGQALKCNSEEFFDKRSKMIGLILKKSGFSIELEALKRHELKLHLDTMLTWYRDVLVAKAGAPSDEAFINIDKKDAIKKESHLLTFDRIEDIIRKIMETGIFLEWNVNPKVAIGALEPEVLGIEGA